MTSMKAAVSREELKCDGVEGIALLWMDCMVLYGLQNKSTMCFSHWYTQLSCESSHSATSKSPRAM